MKTWGGFVLTLMMLCMQPQLAAAEQDSLEPGNSSATEDSTPAIKGRAVHLQSLKGGGLPRITRPPAPRALQTQNPGTASGNEQELLKARVLQAAGFNPLSPTKQNSYQHFALTATELKHLSQYDISVIIDASGSMSIMDCESIHSFINPERISRWEWCREQTVLLSEQISPVFPRGITVIPFASHAERHPNVHPATINTVFESFYPMGATRLDTALALELNSYFQEKEMGLRKKPLMIAIITDGVPSRPDFVLRQLTELTRRTHPNDVKVVFFLIGNTFVGNTFVRFAGNLRESMGASFEIVKSYSFKDVCENGLPRSLAQSVETIP